MFVRRRPLLRAAAVGGTAYMVGKNRAQHQAQSEQGQSEQGQGGSGQPAQPAPPAADSGTGPAVTDQLSRLASLHQQGSLSDSEFAAAKAKLLGT
jgi:Short C-terminal domain